LLHLPVDMLLQDPIFERLLADVATTQAVIQQNLPAARVIMEMGLPPIVERIQKTYHIEHFPLSSFMLGNWVIGYLNMPKALSRLPTQHAGVPLEIMHEVIPEVLAVVGEIPQAGAIWQKTLGTLMLTLATTGATQT
jgi:hypothetical protein